MNNVFVNYKNEERFINLADKYPLEVVKYVQTRAQNSKTMDFHGYINTIMKISARATAALAVWKPEEIKIESKEVFEHFLNDCDYEGCTDYFNVNNICTVFLLAGERNVNFVQAYWDCYRQYVFSSAQVAESIWKDLNLTNVIIGCTDSYFANKRKDYCIYFSPDEANKFLEMHPEYVKKSKMAS